MCDFKGASSFGREFPGGYLEFEISGFEPDFISNFSRFEVSEGLFLHALMSEFVGGFSFLSCVLNLVESLLKG